MAFESETIRTAIEELIEGTIGTTRTVNANVFKSGAMAGKSDGANQALAADIAYEYRFDVETFGLSAHPATPLSNKGSRRIALLPVSILIKRRLPDRAQDAQRKSIRGDMESALEDVIQALALPHNLDENNAGTNTDIIGGCLHGPGGEGWPQYEPIEEDWEQHLATATIEASAIVYVNQATHALGSIFGNLLIALYDIDRASSVRVDVGADQVLDLSDHSVTLTQTTDADQPAYNASGGPDSKGYLDSADATDAVFGSGTEVNSGDRPCLIAIAAFDAYDNSYALYVQDPSPAAIVMLCADTASGMISGAVHDGAAFVITESATNGSDWHLIEYYPEASGHEIVIDGASTVDTDNTAAAGSRADGSNDVYLCQKNSRVTLAAVLRAPPTTAQKAALRTWVAAEYPSLTIS